MSARSKSERFASRIAAAPLAWLVLFYLVPIGLVLAISLASTRVGRPPYEFGFDLSNYAALVADSHYLRAIWNSARLAAFTTLLTLLIGFPMAYVIARSNARRQSLLLLLILVPFWTAFILRVYAWMAILQSNGLINQALLDVGWVAEPVSFLYNTGSVLLGMVYAYLPFMVLPLYSALSGLDWRLLDAAADLGGRPFVSFLTVTLPLSVPGIAAGSVLVFVPALGEFVVPELLGGRSGMMIGKQVWYEFFNNNDWPRAAALSVALIALVFLPLVLRQALRLRSGGVERG
jgi:putrescine transport system permease protein